MTGLGWLRRVVVCVGMCLAAEMCSAGQSARSVIILSPVEISLPWYAAMTTTVRNSLRAGTSEPLAVYVENLDLVAFSDSHYQDALESFLHEKFQAKDIGLIIAIGPATLKFLLRARPRLWSDVPVIFSVVDEDIPAQLHLPPDVTGRTIRLSPKDMLATARVIVPNLSGIALVGDPFAQDSYRRHFLEELPAISAGLDIMDLTGLPMAELKKRVASLPERTAILYTNIYKDGAGVNYVPREALEELAEVANRPIIVDTDTFVGYGGVGGFVAGPVSIGEDAAKVALRILGGEKISEIPVQPTGDLTRPAFDWRQLERWGVNESSLPPGSEIRFRGPSAWEQYHWQIVGFFTALALQGIVISLLLIERRRREAAELESRGRLLEVVHLNRTAAAGALSASIAHELNQPLGAILSNADAAELLLDSNPSELKPIREILSDIRLANQRASEILQRVGKLLKRRPNVEAQEFDLNDAIAEALRIVSPEALKRSVTLGINGAKQPLLVCADRVHVQQVIMNLVINGMDAIADARPGAGTITVDTALSGETEVIVSVADQGTGIPREKLKEIFDTFYTTKEQGTGLGLSIARRIIETYGGKIWAENRSVGGAVFRFSLPLAALT
jgi:signal transduction histidine kinase